MRVVVISIEVIALPEIDEFFGTEILQVRRADFPMAGELVP
jgi:hypothetical protein